LVAAQKGNFVPEFWRFGEKMDAFTQISNAQIVAAILAGEFWYLPGLGQPIPNEPLNYDPNAWIREKMRLEKLRFHSDVRPTQESSQYRAKRD
jgi:hypothetical protein